MRLLVNLLLWPYIPWASRWVAEQEALIVVRGEVLTLDQQNDARRAGVAAPEKIHIMVVDSIQPPNHPVLTFASRFVNLIGPHTAGLTLRYGIYIRKDCSDYQHHRELYVHEFVHTAQYERHGSIHGFLVDYLRECLTPGYPHGPLERQADRTAKKMVGRG